MDKKKGIIAGVVLVAVIVGGILVWKFMPKDVPEMPDNQVVVGEQDDDDVRPIDPDETNMVIDDDGGITYQEIGFEDHNVTYDKGLGKEHESLAKGATLLFLLATAGEIDSEVMEKHFSPWGQKVVEQLWDYDKIDDDDLMDEETVKAMTNTDIEVAKTRIEDDHINVVIKALNYDSYNVYFVDGKVDNVKYMETFFDPSEF